MQIGRIILRKGRDQFLNPLFFIGGDDLLLHGMKIRKITDVFRIHGDSVISAFLANMVDGFMTRDGKKIGFEGAFEAVTVFMYQKLHKGICGEVFCGLIVFDKSVDEENEAIMILLQDFIKSAFIAVQKPTVT